MTGLCSFCIGIECAHMGIRLYMREEGLNIKNVVLQRINELEI